MPSSMRKMLIHIILHMRKIPPGCLLFIHTFCSICSFCLRTASAWSDCADGRANLGLRCPYMPEDTFLHGAVNVMYESVPKDQKIQFITKTYLYSFDPLKSHLYIVKLGFTRVYIIFLISAQKHRLWVLVRTASPRWF